MIKLLLDENISFKVAKGINAFFEDVKHLSDLRLIKGLVIANEVGVKQSQT